MYGQACKHCGKQWYHDNWCPHNNPVVKEAYDFADGNIIGIDKEFLRDMKIAIE